MRPYNAGGHFPKRRYHNGYKRRAATPLMPQQANQPLPDGYQLENYRISSVLSCGGFSIVYLAYDDNDHPVAIKEYLPSQLALRKEGDALPSIAEENLATFRNGLREVHSNKLLHLDIKPANIYIRNDGTPLLIDFGAARQTLTQEGMRLNPMYTPGFAPPEQYKNRDLLGPWSDCYAIGASIFACLGGMAPQPADQRLEKDRYVSATKLWNGKGSRQLLETIDWCLELDNMKRPQSVFALRKVLLREKEPEVHRKKSFAESLRGVWLKVSGR